MLRVIRRFPHQRTGDHDQTHGPCHGQGGKPPGPWSDEPFQDRENQQEPQGRHRTEWRSTSKGRYRRE